MLAVLEQRGGVHHRLAGLRLGRSDHSADDGDAAGFGGNAFRRLAVARHERGALHQVARRIATDGKLGKQDQSRAGGLARGGQSQ